MKTSGRILQMIGVILGILGAIGGLFSFGAVNGFVIGSLTLVASVLTWAFFSALSAACFRLEDIAVDVHRSADALERLAQPPTGVGAAPPVPKIHSIAPRSVPLR